MTIALLIALALYLATGLVVAVRSGVASEFTTVTGKALVIALVAVCLPAVLLGKAMELD